MTQSACSSFARSGVPVGSRARRLPVRTAPLGRSSAACLAGIGDFRRILEHRLGACCLPRLSGVAELDGVPFEARAHSTPGTTLPRLRRSIPAPSRLRSDGLGALRRSLWALSVPGAFEPGACHCACLAHWRFARLGACARLRPARRARTDPGARLSSVGRPYLRPRTPPFAGQNGHRFARWHPPQAPRRSLHRHCSHADPVAGAASIGALRPLRSARSVGLRAALLSAPGRFAIRRRWGSNASPVGRTAHLYLRRCCALHDAVRPLQLLRGVGHGAGSFLAPGRSSRRPLRRSTAVPGRGAAPASRLTQGAAQACVSRRFPAPSGAAQVP